MMNTKTHIKSITIVLLTTLVISVLFGSIVSNHVFASSKTDEVTYSEQEIFEGIFFGWGEYGEKVNKEGYKYNQDAEQAIKQITSLMEKNHPEYLKELYEAVQDKNPVKIDSFIQDGAKLIQETVKNHSEDLIASGENFTLAGEAQCLYAVIWKWIYLWSSPSSEPKLQVTSDNSDLLREQLVERIISQ
ncbi:hypothetical protein [Ornithinibacillus halotolerans]|uniref:SdpC family antimicrobial peptide n=1 Tax=Ornithinibacillus halotolerans TaxID=1274357 RepID=A0A916SBX4_9BACI|nr:hypothetical protein [Ornithinibacillus halotolerans]GGA92930.1 hypothetical protein GCM10008025_39180 [Ornithinibacillus halotolerans]